MKITAHNDLQLDKICQKAYEILQANGSVNITVEEYHKPNTLRQLGFWFGAICNSVVDFYHQKGDAGWTETAVKDLFYQALSPKVKMVKLSGEVYEHPKHISEMDRQEMSKFIDDSLNLIERANCFKGLVLHPSIRNCFVHSMDLQDIHFIDSSKFPRKCPEYLEYRRKQCCLCCGQFGCEAHHIRESENAGVARKANDWETISLCPTCHRLYHTKGQAWFIEKMKWILKYMPLDDFVKVQFNRWFNGFR